ncbi:MAG: ABC transporter ATP-binding protein [Blastocatellia bacterium]
MSIPFAVKAENVSKLYRLDSTMEVGRTLRDVITGSVRRLNPFSATKVAANNEADFQALDNISFEVKPGEIVGIVGRNGAGKSTLLKVISRVTEPTTGKVQIYGRVGSLLEVGTGFHPELSGRENIFLNGSILGMSRAEIERKFDEIVAFSEIERFVDTPVKRYSSGMYVRLAFAVAAHLEPEVLLIDEVLAVGDAAFQQKCLGRMNQVSKEGRTILFVSHNTAALLGLCTRGILLEQGKLALDGSIDSAVSGYLKGVTLGAFGDLTEYKHREGGGRVRFTKVTLEDLTGNSLIQGVSGQPLVIRLKYESNDGNWLPRCRISVAVYDTLGQALINFSSELVISVPVNLPPKGSVRCVIPQLPLTQSNYLLTFFLEVNGVVEDWLHKAIELPVVDGDFYQTGRLYSPGWQGKGVLAPHTWLVED